MTEQPTPDAFASLAALLQMIADPKAAAKRLGELRSLSEDLAQREAKLVADREAFDEHRLRIIGELERDREEVSRRFQMVVNPQNHDYLRHRMAENAQTEEAGA
jgi:hypothetical protein